MLFVFQRCVFRFTHWIWKTFCFACLSLLFDELIHKMDPSIILVVSPWKEKTCWTPLCIKPGDSNKFKF